MTFIRFDGSWRSRFFFKRGIFPVLNGQKLLRLRRSDSGRGNHWSKWYVCCFMSSSIQHLFFQFPAESKNLSSSTWNYYSELLTDSVWFFFLDDISKLHRLVVEFLNNSANAHLFEELEPVEPDRLTQQKKSKKRKPATKEKGKKGSTQPPKKKKKEPELVCGVS